MERVKLYCRGRCVGEAALCGNGSRTEIVGAAEDPGDGLYRAVLVGEQGRMPLGVMESGDRRLILRRRPESSEVARLGNLRCVELICSFPFAKKTSWRRTQTPAQLIQNTFLQERLAGIEHAWWCGSEEKVTLALPLRNGMPFPLMPLFCLARVERVEGERCAVFTFNKHGEPVPHGEKCQKK